MNQEIGRRISILRQQRGWSKKLLAAKVHVSPSLVSQWESGKRGVTREHLDRLADLFGVTIDYLMGRNNITTKTEPSPQSLPPGAWPLGGVVKIPVLGVIRAGEPILAEQNIEKWEEVPLGQVRDGHYFYLRVKGDSMIGADIKDGYLVLVREQPDVDDGDIAVVMVGADEATLKRVRKTNGRLVLWPENPKYHPLLVESNDVRIIGKVVKAEFTPR